MSHEKYIKVDKLKKTKEEEENEDDKLRKEHDASWTIEPSSNQNKTIKMQLVHYQQSYFRSKTADDRMNKSIYMCMKLFSFLQFDKDEIIEKLPKSKDCGKEMSPTALK